MALKRRAKSKTNLRNCVESPKMCLVGRLSGRIRFRSFVERFISSLHRCRLTGVVQRCAVGAARSVEKYIWRTREDTRMLLWDKYFSVQKFLFILHVVVARCGPGSFWAPPAVYQTDVLRRSSCEEMFFLLWLWSYWVLRLRGFLLVCWFYLTSYWFQVRRHPLTLTNYHPT